MTAILLTLALTASPALVLGPVRQNSVEPVRVAFVRAGEPVTLAVALRTPGGTCLAGREGRSVEGHACAMAPAGLRASVRWFLAIPVPLDYDNMAACAGSGLAPGCHAPIQYREAELEAVRGRLEIEVAEVPALAAPGTHRLAVRMVWEGEPLAAPVAAARLVDDDSAPGWFPLVVRRSDGYVGRLSEMLGVPFALAPAFLPGVGHQADQRLAADCVALVVYGRRRLGEHQPYLSPGQLREQLHLVGRAAALLDGAGKVADVGPVREGDVLHFGFQTAVLAEDRPPVGRLDPSDVVIHTYHGVAEELPLGRLPYGRHPVEVLRWEAQVRVEGKEPASVDAVPP